AEQRPCDCQREERRQREEQRRAARAEDHERAEEVGVAEDEAHEPAHGEQRDLGAARPGRPRRAPRHEQRQAEEDGRDRDAQPVQDDGAHAPAGGGEEVGAGGPAQRGPEGGELARKPHAAKAPASRHTPSPRRRATWGLSLPALFPCPAETHSRSEWKLFSPAKRLGVGSPMKLRREPSVPPRTDVGRTARPARWIASRATSTTRGCWSSTSFMLR